ncbi:apolipoprotein D-like [Liolophura sinensis]|uniref:apolipoprotein D-like n=1 Tax=Liolophura sinensis TaxID=3198878 RepID=UPI0031590324
MPNFDASQYLGKWYEHERFFSIAEYDEDCVSANYSLKADGKVKVVNQGVIIGTSQVDEAVGEAYAPDPNFPAKLLVIFGGPPSNYWVLDTDYKTYTVVWSCRDTKTRQAHTGQYCH